MQDQKWSMAIVTKKKKKKKVIAVEAEERVKVLPGKRFLVQEGTISDVSLFFFGGGSHEGRVWQRHTGFHSIWWCVKP